MARFDRYTVPSLFTTLSTTNFVGDIIKLTDVYLTSVNVLSVLSNPIIGLGVVGIDYVHTNVLTANIVQVPNGNSNFWNTAYSIATSVSAEWDEFPVVVPAVTDYLSSNPVIIQSLSVLENTDIAGQILSAGVDLFDIFLTEEFDEQILLFDETTQNLTITDGNTVSLTAINSTFAEVSSKYEDVYTLVKEASSTWEDEQLILPTVTNYLTTSNVTISSLLVPEYNVITTTNTNYVFSNSDSGKVFHFNTTIAPEMTATFLTTLKDGFNVGIVNIGTGIIYVANNFLTPFNARGSSNSVQHTGMFIYKANNELFGIGIFE